MPLTSKEVETVNARLLEAAETRFTQEQRAELDDLRKRVGPRPLNFSEIKDGQPISPQQLVELNRLQARGQLDSERGLKRVTLVDSNSGRPIHFFFGSERGAWEAFTNAPKKRGFINRNAE